MNTDQKIIKNKVGVLKVAEMLGSVSQACKDDEILTRLPGPHLVPRQDPIQSLLEGVCASFTIIDDLRCLV